MIQAQFICRKVRTIDRVIYERWTREIGLNVECLQMINKHIKKHESAWECVHDGESVVP